MATLVYSMDKLSNHVFSAIEKPRALVLAGGVGVGKTYFLEKLGKVNVPVYGLDKYYSQDLPLTVASKKVDQEVDQAVGKKQSFVYDTTGANSEKVKELLRKGYEVMMVMVYAHPMVAFESNFSRDRKVPKASVFQNWEKVYKQIDDYRQLLGDNFILTENVREDMNPLVDVFNRAARDKQLPDFILAYVEQDPERYRSSYSKDFQLTPAKEVQFQALLRQSRVSTTDNSILKDLRKDFDKMGHLYEKQGSQRVVDRYSSFSASKTKANQEFKTALQNIAGLVQCELKDAVPLNQAINRAKLFLTAPLRVGK